MIIIDTSVWVDHFRRPIKAMQELIAESDIALHPYVYGELLLGGLPTKGDTARQLLKLARSPVASASEAAAFIEWAELSGTGIGYVDSHLLVSAKLFAGGCVLTKDKKLQDQAKRLGLAYLS
jgi:predicted nucleic acid-binding protein